MFHVAIPERYNPLCEPYSFLWPTYPSSLLYLLQRKSAIKPSRNPKANRRQSQHRLGVISVVAKAALPSIGRCLFTSALSSPRSGPVGRAKRFIDVFPVSSPWLRPTRRPWCTPPDAESTPDWYRRTPATIPPGEKQMARPPLGKNLWRFDCKQWDELSLWI